MADIITPEVSKRICAHMNDDHPEAVLLYARVYGNQEKAIAAKMTDIDPEGMDLDVTLDHQEITVRIPFARALADSEDAHQTLIEMVRKARQSP